jgi:hypothetical protein
LRLEPLESRDVPVTFGTPWADGRHVTLGFARDGTSILGTGSDLGTTVFARDAGARFAVLRAFQAWAVHANLNVGLVADSGAAFGTDAAGDGDIRVGGRPLAPDVLAVTAPSGGDPYSGSVVLNTAAHFGAGGYDLYTAALQEAGHAFGVGNSPDPASAMYEYYGVPRPDLAASDVAAIRALYGTRDADTYEGVSGNDTIATATPLRGAATADLTTATDRDVYALTAAPLTERVTVRLRASGLSLLTARVEVLDADGRTVATAAAIDSERNDVTVSFAPARAGAAYFVRVSAARADEFAVGSYELEALDSSTEPGGDSLVVGHSVLKAAVGPGVAPVPELAAGSLLPGGRTESFTLAQSGQVRVALATTGETEAVVADATGREWGRFTTTAGRGRSLDLFLGKGVYRVTVRPVGGGRIDFRLGLLVVTDPIGVRPADPTPAPDQAVPLSGVQPPAAAPPPIPVASVMVPPSPPSGGAASAPPPGGVQLTQPPGTPKPQAIFMAPARSRTAALAPVEYAWY